MKYAIDRYILGTEKEVDADEFNGINVPNRKERFFCPECGEKVFYRNKGGKQPSQFYHQKETERTPECDKRVDGRSELSLSQRVGLPVYITRTITKYNLWIGFPALTGEILDVLSSQNCKIRITDGVHYHEVNVDHTHFIENETTLIPLNFIPKNKENYTIKIVGDNKQYVDLLKQKISDYADGFDEFGGLFSYNENGGKKIRRGDSISAYRYYYAIVKSKYSIANLKEIELDKQGNLKIGNESYTIWKIIIKVSVEDKAVFNYLCSFFKNNFGVWFLERVSELIPIWPPVIKRDCYIPVDSRTGLLCAVSSGNKNPCTYIYSEKGVQKKEIDYKINDVNIVKINICNKPVCLSVDRKYTGREISITSKDLPVSTHRYKIHIEDKNGKIFSIKELEKKIFTQELLFVTNAKCELSLETKSKKCRLIAIREEYTKIPPVIDCNEIFLLIEKAVIMQFKVNDIKVLNTDQEFFKNLVNSVNMGVLVPIPRWCISMVHRFKINNQNELYELITSSFVNGKIYSEMLKKLWQLYICKNLINKR
ncbi:hypothetical protein [Succinimonas sp.]|uniref:hypothetical protein n=1 Tax=Succinimonas sp. TaxID=1936151 RepID=UPI0038681BDD